MTPDQTHLPAGENPQPANAPLEKAFPKTPRAAQRNDPLHGITLKSILNQLVQKHGWREMGRRIPIRCFKVDPTIKSSLTFLRKTPWAREKVEDWFIGELLRKNDPPQDKASAPAVPTDASPTKSA